MRSKSVPQHATLYGIRLHSELPITAPLCAADPPADVRITTSAAEPPGEWTTGAPLYVDAPAAAPGLVLFQGSSGFCLHFPRAGEFYLGLDTLHFRPATDGDPVLAENFLLGPVLALWLEQRGIPMLHASVCVPDTGAVAFLATSQGGKTSLAAALLATGAALLSDDMLPLERRGNRWWARPGYPQMRMWPEQVLHFLGDVPSLTRVHPYGEKLRVPVGSHFGRFQHSAEPLRAIYLPERREVADPNLSTEFERLSPAAGLIQLIRHSFMNRVVHSAGLQPNRFPLLAEIARTVPIVRLSYPSGMEHLSGVADAVIHDARLR